MLISLLALGLLLGLRHALEADHVAAVATLAMRSATLRETLRVSAAWGIGHAATLVVFGAVLVLLGATLPSGVANALEAAVGVMLIVLGVDVLRRLRQRRVHFHLHSHDRGVRHLHLHAHDGDRARHEHAHGKGFVPRALFVGCVHGLAGTAGLVLLAVPAMQSGARALLYLAVFGVGTIVGMMGFSLLISVPLMITARRLHRATFALELVLGAANLALGGWIAVRSVGAMIAG